MRIFALETNVDKLKGQYLSRDEREILTAFHHGLLFFFKSFLPFLVTIGLAVVGGVLITMTDLPAFGVILALFVIWFFFVFFRILRAYIDWRYDFLFLTSDKLVIVDQTSIFHQKITPMNLENVASVSTETQFYNIFSFGAVRLNLKEGVGTDIRLGYIPNADAVAAAISDAATVFQRRKDLRLYG